MLCLNNKIILHYLWMTNDRSWAVVWDRQWGLAAGSRQQATNDKQRVENDRRETNGGWCNILPNIVPCLSHSTILRSCYCCRNRPCPTATFDHSLISVNFRLGFQLHYFLSYPEITRNKCRGNNYKFSVWFPRLPHIVSSSLSPAASVYYEKVSMPHQLFSFYKVLKYLSEAG